MSHFSDGDWVDFTRGLVPEPENAEIRSHLERECPECLESIAFWNGVLESLSPDESFRVPSHVLSRIIAEYTLQKPWRWLAEAARWAELVFDSFSQAQLAPVRGSGPNLAPVSRQLIHELEPFVVDLRLELHPGRGSLWVIGQILNSQEPSDAMPSIRLILLDGDDLVVGTTTAGSSGEFEFQCGITSNLRLFINISGQRAIGIAIPGMDT